MVHQNEDIQKIRGQCPKGLMLLGIQWKMLNPQATKGGGGCHPPYVFIRKIFFNMEYNFGNLGSCSRYIGAHFEVNIMVVAYAIQKLYLIYPGPQGGGVDTTPPLVFRL